MGTQQTNDDGAMGLPSCDPVTIKIEPVDPPPPMSKHSAWQEMLACAKALGLDRFRSWSNVKAAVEGLPLVALGPDSTRRLAVIADEQRMADVFAECALAVDVMWQVQDALPGAGYERRLDLATRLSRAADSLETAIARANGGAA